MNVPSRLQEFVALLSGFTLWAVAFVTLYASHGFACASAAGSAAPAGTRAWLVGALILFLAGHAWLIAWLFRRWRNRPKDGAAAASIRTWSLALAVGGMVATAWSGLPVATLSICT